MDFSRYGRQHLEAVRRCQRIVGPIGVAMLIWLGLSASAHADTNPGYDRPGLGFTPVALDPGAVTVEQGLPDWTRSSQGDTTSSLYTADSLIRLGLGHQLELQVGGSLYNYLQTTQADRSEVREGHGDSSLSLKYVLPSSNQAFSWGLLGSVLFTDGAPALRSPQRQYLLGLQLNLQVDSKNSLGAYVQDLRSGGSDAQILAFSDNYLLSPDWMLYAEAALEHNPGSRSGTLAGAGAGWQITERVQLDASFRHRLSGQVNDWEAGLGVSIYFGR